jgi:nicotinamidase-related amidase
MPQPLELDQVYKLYRNRGFAERIGFGQRPAVIVIDLIRGFTDPTSPLGSDFSELLRHTSQLLQHAREAGVPIVFTTVEYESEQAREGGFFVKKIPALKTLVHGTCWTELDPRLERTAEDFLIAKKFASAFFGTPLHSHLTSMGIDTLILAGATTSGCVRATAVDGIQLGYRVIVPEECVGDRAELPHWVSLLDIDSKYGDVVPLADVVHHLRHRRASR